MATVTLAEDCLLRRQVALKRLTVPGDPRGLSRLRREALIGASLSHPNLVSIFDVVETEEGEQFIVMEYVPGETLREAVRREGAMPPQRVLPIIDGVAAALDAIHREGIVHRDVKPGNILLAEDGAVKLADLGIAAALDRTRITTAGALMGSFRYMAPEQLEDRRPTPAIDVYALGAVAFEALCGRSARLEPNPVALAHAMSTQPPPDLRDTWPEAPRDAAKLIQQALSRDPDKRPRSAGELATGLRHALHPPAPSRRPKPASRRPEPAPRRSPVVARDRAAAVPVARRAQPAARRGAAAAPSRPAPSRPLLATDDPPSSRRPLALILLGLAAVLLVGFGLLSQNGSSSRSSGPRASAPPAGGPRTAHARSPTRSSAAGHGSGAGAAGSAAGAGSSSRSATGGVAGGTALASSGEASGANSSSGGKATGAGAGAGAATASSGAPVSAVENFYELAAAHRYSEAWSLADPTFRSQLQGYSAFAAGQAADRSITFNGARVISQSPGAATVAIATTSVRTDGTTHCTGTVDLQASGGASWLLHTIHINCA